MPKVTPLSAEYCPLTHPSPSSPPVPWEVPWVDHINGLCPLWLLVGFGQGDHHQGKREGPRYWEMSTPLHRFTEGCSACGRPLQIPAHAPCHVQPRGVCYSFSQTLLTPSLAGTMFPAAQIQQADSAAEMCAQTFGPRTLS